jgi:hypothetical protein
LIDVPRHSLCILSSETAFFCHLPTTLRKTEVRFVLAEKLMVES